MLTIHFTEFAQIEEPHSTPYKDVMAWFSMGKLRQKGRLSHTCMQQVFIFFNKQVYQLIFFCKWNFPIFSLALTYTFIVLGWSGTPWQRRY